MSIPFYDQWRSHGPDDSGGRQEDPPKGTCPRCNRAETYLYRVPGKECCIQCVDAPAEEGAP